MEYFYTPPHLVRSDELTIDGDEFVHLTHVMRKKAGDVIRVVDGIGTAYDASIADISKRVARCEIIASHTRLNESGIDLTLGVGILKNSSRFDFLVEKVTELGANTIVPLFTERTIPHHAKTDRWQKLALAAMKQSGRCILPTVAAPMSFDDLLASVPDGCIKLLPHQGSNAPLAASVRQFTLSPVVVCIGPEGGFSDHEIELSLVRGFQTVSLGPARLRTETAAIVALTLVLAHQAGS
jgi:16S rRNA (uracil1498-N3)-methyltransferase